MRTVTLTGTGEENFFVGSDGAYYTPVSGVEAKCRWCGRWGHPAGLYYREVLYTRRTAWCAVGTCESMTGWWPDKH